MIVKRCQHYNANGKQCELVLGHPPESETQEHDYNDPRSPFHDSNRQSYDNGE